MTSTNSKTQPVADADEDLFIYNDKVDYSKHGTNW